MDIDYELLKREQDNKIKRQTEVILKMKIDREQLGKIALQEQELKNMK